MPWWYVSDGTARRPGRFRAGPPNCTGRRLEGAYACAGSWHDAHDTWPDADNALSLKSERPSATSVLKSGRRSYGVS